MYDMELNRMQVVLTFAKNLKDICVKLCSLSSKDPIPMQPPNFWYWLSSCIMMGSLDINV